MQFSVCKDIFFGLNDVLVSFRIAQDGDIDLKVFQENDNGELLWLSSHYSYAKNSVYSFLVL